MTTAPSGPELRLGGHLVVDALIAHGVDMVFGVPGATSRCSTGCTTPTACVR